MKRLLLTLYQSLFLFSIICAGTVKVGKLWYNIDMQELTAEVTKSVDGEYYDEIVIPKQVDYEHITFNVTSIGDKAFYDCDSISSVIIPEGIKSIGKMAFMGCTPPSGSRYNGIKVINVPNSVLTIGGQAFAGCAQLKTLVLPQNLSIIEGALCSNCRSLTSIVIPSNVTEIGDYAFSECSNLKAVTLSQALTIIGRFAFYNCVKLAEVNFPAKVNTIEEGAFEGCHEIKSIKIPKDITTISKHAFSSCISLNEIEIPEGATSIQEFAFSHCRNLTQIHLPNSIAGIYGGAFSMCTGLTSIYIPENVNIIGSFGATTNPFLGCSSLSTIVVDNNNKTYDSRKDCNAIIETNSNTLISGCGNTRIPEGITALGDDSFRWCENVTYIEMPKTINSIGHSAFEGCKDLTIIKSYIEEPPEIGKWTFKDCYETTILYVPYGTVEKYKQTAGWNLFVHIAELEKDQTSIIHPKSDRNKCDNIFNLNGCKMYESSKSLDRLSKGIYIINGNKIVKK